MPKKSLYKLTNTCDVSSNSKQILKDFTVARFCIQIINKATVTEHLNIINNTSAIRLISELYWLNQQSLQLLIYSYASDTRTRNLYKLTVKETCTSVIATCSKIFLVQASCSRASFLLETEHFLFDVPVQETCTKNLLQVSCTCVTGTTQYCLAKKLASISDSSD